MAVSCYGANNYVFGNPPKGTADGYTRLPSGVPDGLSNTVFFAEMYATCGNSGDPNSPTTYASLWANANSVWRPGFNLGINKSGASLANYPPSKMFQANPSPFKNCDYTVPSRLTVKASTWPWAMAAFASCRPTWMQPRGPDLPIPETASPFAWDN